ncbi:unnamed protein product [Ixodes persulcatus]
MIRSRPVKRCPFKTPETKRGTHADRFEHASAFCEFLLKCRAPTNGAGNCVKHKWQRRSRLEPTPPRGRTGVAEVDEVAPTGTRDFGDRISRVVVCPCHPSQMLGRIKHS